MDSTFPPLDAGCFMIPKRIRTRETMKAKFAYTGIRVKDLDESVAFYTRVLGMKEIGRSPVDATKGATASLVSQEGGPVLELNYYEKGGPHAATYVEGSELDHLAFQVDDLDKALAEANN